MTFDAYFAALTERHMQLPFPQLRKAVQAVSVGYVQRRGRREAWGEGKRAAFALYYGALHFLLIREVVSRLGLGSQRLDRIVDLGCGTGVGAAAWALEMPVQPRLICVDKSNWALAEARWTLRTLGLSGSFRRGDLVGAQLPRKGSGLLAAFAINELPEGARNRILPRLRGALERGAQLLVVEPVAKQVAPWWGEWVAAFAPHGREDLWEIEIALPDLLKKLDRASGLDHSVLKARTLCAGQLL